MLIHFFNTIKAYVLTLRLVQNYLLTAVTYFFIFTFVLLIGFIFI